MLHIKPSHSRDTRSSSHTMPLLNRPAYWKAIIESHSLICAPAAERNKGPILEVLRQFINTSNKGHVLEIASGTGQHVVHFAKFFPSMTFHPSDCDVRHINSIEAHINRAKVQNVLHPSLIDVTMPVARWPDHTRFTAQSLDVIININMIHISAWDTCKCLMCAAGYLLKPSGLLYMYGPFMVDGKIFPESNVRFDRSLRSTNSEWGLRDLSDVKQLAERENIHLYKTVDMPANNKSLIFYKTTL